MFGIALRDELGGRTLERGGATGGASGVPCPTSVVLGEPGEASVRAAPAGTTGTFGDEMGAAVPRGPEAGAGMPWGDLGLLALWAVVAGVLAARTFRWE